MYQGACQLAMIIALVLVLLAIRGIVIPLVMIPHLWLVTIWLVMRREPWWNPWVPNTPPRRGTCIAGEGVVGGVGSYM